MNDVITTVYHRQVGMVYRICFTYMKNAADAEDAVQDVFVKLMRYNPALESEEHEKAWLIRCAINVCKNMLRKKSRQEGNIDDYHHLHSEEENQVDQTLTAVLALPDKYKHVVYLYYYEGYDSTEIAKMLHKSASTIRSNLMRARILLKETLKGDE